MEDTRHIVDLLHKYLQDDLLEAESRALQQWADSAPEYRLYLDNLTVRDRIPLDLKRVADRWSVVSDDLQKRLEQNVLSHPHRRGIVRTRYRWWLPYAAAVLLISAAVGYFAAINRDSFVDSPTKAEILPGGNRATLKLANGQTIDLSEAQNGIIVGDSITYLDGSAVTEHRKLETAKELVLTTPKGGTYQVTLPDGTNVWLNAASTLQYPSRFGEDSRVVTISGEGYFAVAKDTKRPFRVISDGHEIAVLGTEFNISAYQDDPETRTTLVEGRVRLSQAGESLMLLPGEQGISKEGGLTKAKIDIGPYIAWKSGYFRFQNLPITEIMRQLTRWYDIEVEYEGPVKDVLYSGRVSRKENISAVLRMMELADAVKFEIHENERRVVVKH